MATIKDIAQEAGVSVVTVSNVIRGAKSHVSKATYEKVTKLIEKHHYTPNMMARTLVTKNSHLVGFIKYEGPLKADEKNGEIPSDGTLQFDPFFELLLRSAGQILSSKNYYVMIKAVTTKQEFQNVCDNWNLAGLIVYGVHGSCFFNEPLKTKIPCLFIDSYIQNEEGYHVGLDDYEAAYGATEYLISKGHRNIAFASPVIFESGVVRERFEGYKAALLKGGIQFEPKNVYEVPSLSNGILLGKKIAERGDLTAVFSTADLLALGIMSGLHRSGKKIPRDISVMGFDDLFECNLSIPTLTSVRQNVRKKAEAAVNNLIDLIDGKQVARKTLLPVQIVERESVMEIKG